MLPTPAFRAISLYLTAKQRRHELLPLASAIAALRILAALIEAAQDAAAATRLKAESLRERAQFERELRHVVEMIADEPDGADLVASLLGDEGVLLADALLDD
jgi:hypothetical protein